MEDPQDTTGNFSGETGEGEDRQADKSSPFLPLEKKAKKEEMGTPTWEECLTDRQAQAGGAVYHGMTSRGKPDPNLLEYLEKKSWASHAWQIGGQFASWSVAAEEWLCKRYVLSDLETKKF